MANDLSRIRFDPSRNHAGVELRQGAVLLDADANEGAAIADRRLRALASDAFGRARVSSTTPDAFKITLQNTSAPFGLKIGKGRMYVDGLLAENHGTGAATFDALMGEATCTDAVPYDRQPYLFDAPALPTAGRHIVYLDTWHRTITHVEAPDLAEIAVGVETSGRTQAAWQVRVLDTAEVGANATCESSDEAWNALVAPSTGLLSTGTFEDPAILDPCELPPSGGYRGLENQLYRVEIHAPGKPGAGATFKFSRENASVVVPVEAWVNDKELRLGSLGRDDVLGFKTGDWVEIVDDALEFLRQPGQMRRITVEHGTRHITFDDALPASLNTDPAGRHLRVVRWDQANKVRALDANGVPVLFEDMDASTTGTIPVPAAGTTLVLEHGITVAFDASTGDAGMRTGDYWVFAARTADASLEKLDRAPARGTHHHYARLALWDVGGGALTDCRQGWPPPTAAGGDDCACTVCVKPRDAESLREAIDKIRANGGGTICLDIGEYVLKAPLVIGNVRSLRIVGKGSGTVLRSQRGPGVMRIEENANDIVLSAFAMGKGEGGSGDPILAVSDASRVGLDRLTFESLRGDVAAVALGNRVEGLWMRDCMATTPVGVTTLERGAQMRGICIEGNTLRCVNGAIVFEAGQSRYEGGNRVRANRFVCEKRVAITAHGNVSDDAAFDIEGNHIVAPGGIDSNLNRQRIVGNTLDGARSGSVGILLTPFKDSVDDQMIVGNRIEGYADAIVLKGSLQRMMIKQNQIALSRSGITIAAGQAAALSIENNQLSVDGMALRVDGEKGSVAIVGNQVEAPGEATSIRVRGEALACTFDGNHCRLLHDGRTPAVLLQAHSAQAASNRIRGDGRTDALVSLLVQAKVATVLGNITRGAIDANPPNAVGFNIENVPD